MTSMVAGVLPWAGVSIAQTTAYMVIYAANAQDGGIARDSHNFAAFARAPAGSLESDTWYERRPTEAFTISWLPAVMPICLTCIEPQTGRDYGLRETLAYEHAAGLRVSAWGPYEIDPRLYAMAKRQYRRLATGTVRYLLWDRGWRPWAMNCIHAVTDLDTTRPRLATGASLGDAASARIVAYFRPYVRARPVGLAARLATWLGVSDLPTVNRTP